MPRACVRKRTFAASALEDNQAMGTRTIQNELLAAMPRKTYDALAPALAPVTIVFGEVLYAAGAPITHVYFPCESMVSLLLTRDRRRSAKFRMTHEFLSHMLGVRRVGVTEAASSLQRQKLIEYTRGNIHILDEPGLEAACCACYGLVKAAGVPLLS